MESEISKIHRSEHFNVFASKKFCERSEPVKFFQMSPRHEKAIQQLLQVQGFRMITNMCTESEHRKNLRARMLHLKMQNSYAKEAILCKQNIAFSCVFTTFLTSNGSKIFSIGHIHVIWVLERSALMSSFKW